MVATSDNLYAMQAVEDDYNAVVNEISADIYDGADYMQGCFHNYVKQQQAFPHLKHNLVFRLKETDRTIGFYSFVVHGHKERPICVGMGGRMHKDFHGQGLFKDMNDIRKVVYASTGTKDKMVGIHYTGKISAETIRKQDAPFLVRGTVPSLIDGGFGQHVHKFKSENPFLRLSKEEFIEGMKHNQDLINLTCQNDFMIAFWVLHHHHTAGWMFKEAFAPINLLVDDKSSPKSFSLLCRPVHCRYGLIISIDVYTDDPIAAQEHFKSQCGILGDYLKSHNLLGHSIFWQMSINPQLGNSMGQFITQELGFGGKVFMYSHGMHNKLEQNPKILGFAYH